MSFNRLIALIVLSLIHSSRGLPTLCLQISEPLPTFTTITQLVNDSYLVTDYKNYSVFEIPHFVKFHRHTTDDIPGFKDNAFVVDIAFVIDIDRHCFNVQEKLFVLSEGSSGYKYAFFTDKWISPRLMEANHPELEVFKGVSDMFGGTSYKLILYFQSIGLLLIQSSGMASKFIQCSNNGWIVSDIKLEIDIDIGFNFIKSGFVDNDKQSVYFFKTDSITNFRHIRNTFYYCNYSTPTSSKIVMKCEEKAIKELCSFERMWALNPKKKSFNIWLFVLIILVIAILLVSQVIVCLLCCPKKKEKSEKTHKTLGPDKTSHAVNPDETKTLLSKGQNK